jgi:MOSC domain-containing protein YiiM
MTKHRILIPADCGGQAVSKRPSPLDRYARNLRHGTVSWIGLRSGRRGDVVSVDTAMAIAERGLDGDHRMDKTPGSGRQVTVISEEFIAATAHFLGRDAIDPQLLRRNIVVSGINLNGLRHQRFQVGEALLEATELCHPCSRMEEVLGVGGYAAMLGHGGLCARILVGGRIAIDDEVRVVFEVSA